MQSSESGATALCMMLGYYNRFVSVKEMREICISSRNGSSPEQIAAAADHYGLKATIQNLTIDELKGLQFPVMIRWKKRYYALIKSIRNNVVTVVDPSSGIYKMKMEKLEQLFTGTVITFEKGENFRTGGRQESLAALIKGRLRPILGQMLIILAFTAACVGLNLAMMYHNKYILDTRLNKSVPHIETNGHLIFSAYFILMLIYGICPMQHFQN